MHTTKITEFHNNNQCVSVNITWLDREYMNYLDWSKKPLLALVDRNVFRSCLFEKFTFQPPPARVVLKDL